MIPAVILGLPGDSAMAVAIGVIVVLLLFFVAIFNGLKDGKSVGND